jgi:hypothetical protein
MNRFFLILLIFAFCTSCKTSYIQIFETDTTNTQLKNDFFVYETDTLKITYSFWDSKGVVKFVIHNKLDKPIYIDWKNSSFIYNDNKLNYWVDEAQTKSSSYYGGYYYSGPLIKPGFTINEMTQNLSSSTIKPERITFIPPKSNCFRSQFYLLPISYYNLKFDSNSFTVPRNDNPSKDIRVYYKVFNYDNSPLRFRNYLSFSFSENSQQYFYIDNEFFLNSVMEMDYRKRENLYEKPFKKQTSFYIKISNGNSYKMRRYYNY